MNAPESQSSADEALSSLMGAIVDSPEYALLVSAPVTPARDWKSVQAAIDEYLDRYELRLDERCDTPTEFERFLLVDAIAGLMDDNEFINALYAAVTAAATAGDARAARDAAFEAVRKRLCALPRYSFWIGDHGGVKRVEDRSGAWIDFDAAHELFDPVAVDAAIAAQQGKGDPQ